MASQIDTQEGIDSLLSAMNQNKTPYVIPKEVCEALQQKVYNKNQGFISYVEAQQWVKQEYDLDLKYNTGYLYLLLN